MAEREGFLPDNPDAPDPHHEVYQELAPGERSRIENNFLNYIDRQYDDTPDTWPDEARYRHIAFNYSHDRYRAERQAQISGNFHPFLESIGTWSREIGIAAAIGATVKGGAALLGISGGPISWIGASVIGGITGGLVGYRRGGERYVSKNLNADRLSLEFGVEGLLKQHADYLEHLRLEPDDRFSEGRVLSGAELPDEYFAKAAEVLEKLDRLAQTRSLGGHGPSYIRGDIRSRRLLADQRGELAAILESRDFFEEITHRGVNTTDRNALAQLWVDRQEYRQRHSLVEQFNEGISQRGKEFVEEQRQAAKAASKRGAIGGALSGAILAGAFSYFLGEHIPKGTGRGQLEGEDAIRKALENRDTGSIARQLEHIAVTDLEAGHFSADSANAANRMMQEYGLPKITHYLADDGSGTNYLYTFLKEAHDKGLTGKNLETAVYNFLSHYDHNPTGVSPEDWHKAISGAASNPIFPDYLNNMRNPNHFNEVRELFIDRLRLAGELNPVSIPNVTGVVTQSEFADAAIGAIAGITAGNVAVSGKEAEMKRDSEDQLTYGEAEFHRVGKPRPGENHMYELLPGASDNKNNSIYRTLIAEGLTPPFIFRIDNVAGQGAAIHLLIRDDEGNLVEAKNNDLNLNMRDVSFKQLLDPAFRYRGDWKKPQPPPPPAPAPGGGRGRGGP